MKLTDFAVIFVVIVWCIFSNISFQNDLLRENIYGATMYNHIMDHISEDALRWSLDFEDYRPVIDKEKILDCITREIGSFYMGISGYEEYLKEAVKLVILTYPDGFYLAGNKGELSGLKWGEKILYSQGSITPMEKKVNEILEITDKTYNIELLIPNTGSSSVNTIEDYQLLLVYQAYPFVFKGKEYKKLIFSGAKINYDILFAKPDKQKQ